jgi:GTP cyclohydrolase II
VAAHQVGVNIIGSQSHIVASNDFNAKYLRTKAQRMAHVLPTYETCVLFF